MGNGKYIGKYKRQHRDFPGGPVVKTSSSNAGCAGSIPGRRAKISHALEPKNQNIKQKQYCNKFNKDFKNNGPHQKILKKKKEYKWMNKMWYIHNNRTLFSLKKENSDTY